MKIKQMFCWSWEFNIPVLLIYFGILLVVKLLIALLALVNPADHGINISQDAVIMILPLIKGIRNFSSGLRWGGVNGVSRRSVYISLMATFISLAAVLAAGNTLLRLLFFWAPGYIDLSAFYELYGGWTAGVGAVAVECVNFVWIFVACLFLGMLGFFLGGAYYRLGGRGRLALVAGLPVGAFVLLPLLLAALPESAQKALVRSLGHLGSFFMQGPLQMALVFLIGSVLFGFFAWLLIRRAPIQPAALS